MNLSLPDFIILALATWYLAHALTKTHGPFNAFESIRKRFSLGGLTTCMHCSAVWIAALLWAAWQTPLQPLVYFPAIAGLAIGFGSWTGASHA